MFLKSLNFFKNKDFTVLLYKLEYCRNTTSLLLITKEHCQLVADCCILRSVTVQFVYTLFQTWKTCIGATKWPNYKKTNNKNEFGILKNTSLYAKFAKFGEKTANCSMAASGGRELGGHKIGYISLFSSLIVTIFFLIERLKIVLFFETYYLSVPQTQCHLAAKLSKNCSMGPGGGFKHKPISVKFCRDYFYS